MGWQAFGFCKAHRRRRKRSKALGADALDTHALEEVVKAEA